MTSPDTPRLERLVGVVLQWGVWASTACLAVGLLMSFVASGPLATLLLDTGVIVLLATPIARVLVSIVEYVTVRDWRFVALTVIVLIELMAGVAAALLFNRKL